MGGYIIKRMLFAIPTLFVVSIGIFLMVRLLPGDIIDILFGGDQTASEEVKQQAREQKKIGRASCRERVCLVV